MAIMLRWAWVAACLMYPPALAAPDLAARSLLQADSASCGALGGPCCSGDDNYQLCPAGYNESDAKTLRCDGEAVTGTCEKCGGANEPCCQYRASSDPSCDTGNACSAGTCKACGADGLICCSGDDNYQLCPAGYNVSDAKTLRCDGEAVTGTCEKCGGANEPCCQRAAMADLTCEDADQTLTCSGDTPANSSCVKCGQAGEACCRAYSTAPPECGEGFNCEEGVGLGQCEACGDVGQACCEPASSCATGGICSGGTCAECGGLGQPCCPSDSDSVRILCGHAGNAMCLEGVCTACGRPGEPCCTGDDQRLITGSTTKAEDFVCWSGATCPDSRLCPADPVPAASEAEKQLCVANYAELELGFEEDFFSACVGAAANTECTETVLSNPAGSQIVPDWCIDYSSNRTVPTFDCPAAAATAPKYVYCSESSRTTECGNTLCVGGDMECEPWSPRDEGYTHTYTIRPGSAARPSANALYMPAVACDGSLHILSRPGFNTGLYAVVIDSELQTVLSCAFGCVNVPLELSTPGGTTIAWAASAGVPTDRPGATSEASATFWVKNYGGFVCVSPSRSHTTDRQQHEVTCLLLDSPDDVPTSPVFPNATTILPPDAPPPEASTAEATLPDTPLSRAPADPQQPSAASPDAPTSAAQSDGNDTVVVQPDEVDTAAAGGPGPGRLAAVALAAGAAVLMLLAGYGGA